MVGSALLRRLSVLNSNILIADRKAVNLTRQQETEDWILENRPDVIFLAAAKVGGILVNANYPALHVLLPVAPDL
jgi:GDP-L-fucose synthase